MHKFEAALKLRGCVGVCGDVCGYVEDLRERVVLKGVKLCVARVDHGVLPGAHGSVDGGGSSSTACTSSTNGCVSTPKSSWLVRRVTLRFEAGFSALWST